MCEMLTIECWRNVTRLFQRRQAKIIIIIISIWDNVSSEHQINILSQQLEI